MISGLAVTMTLGAVVVAMVATCGDEAFVMLAMMPGTAVVAMVILLVAGVALRRAGCGCRPASAGGKRRWRYPPFRFSRAQVDPEDQGDG